MQQYQIEPLNGVGPVRLGASRAEVHAILGTPTAAPVRAGEMFFDGFFVHYDSSDRVEFIELAPSTQFLALFHGVALHQLPADEAVAFVSRHATYDTEDPELGYSYIFPELQLSLWRAVVPSPDQHPDDPTGRRFEALGIGVRGYFAPSA